MTSIERKNKVKDLVGRSTFLPNEVIEELTSRLESFSNQELEQLEKYLQAEEQGLTQVYDDAAEELAQMVTRMQKENANYLKIFEEKIKHAELENMMGEEEDQA